MLEFNKSVKGKPQNTVASGSIQKVPWFPSFCSCFHPQKVFDHTCIENQINSLAFQIT
jgi:hypothetical protein